MSIQRLQIGDLIIYNHKSTGHPYAGVITRIAMDKWGHQNSVFVKWQGLKAPNYHEDYGYAGTNILNLRDHFKVVRH